MNLSLGRVLLTALSISVLSACGGGGSSQSSSTSTQTSTQQADTSAPVITLQGDSTVTLNIGETYVEAGATAQDDKDGNTAVTISGSVDSSKGGEHTITYQAVDSAGNKSTATRKVVVLDNLAPTITLNGEAAISIPIGGEYTEQGASASDETDGALNVTVSGQVNTDVIGEYVISYSAEDSSGNRATITRTVKITDGTPPIVSLNGEAEVTILHGEQYVELGATASDDTDGNLEVVISGSVNSQILGVHIITYTATDKSGNSSSISRKVTVKDGTAPVVTLNGLPSLSMFQGEDYTDPGATAVDNVDGSVIVTLSGAFDIDTPGDYQIVYTAKDKAGNSASVTRDIEIKYRRPYITSWNTSLPGKSGSSQLEIVGQNGTYTIDWGDGNIDKNITGTKRHTYPESGIYTVKIFSNDTFNTFMGLGDTDNTKLVSIVQWGDIVWGNLNLAYSNAENMTYAAIDNPNLSQVTSMSNMFHGATKFNGDISGWDVSNVTDMSYMFEDAESFNQDIGNWDISNVTSILRMFANAKRFNQDIGNWDTSKVTEMRGVFSQAEDFNQDIGRWNTSNVRGMHNMFSGAKTFNQDIGNWDTSKVTQMYSMFLGAKEFNQDISSWDTSTVVYMSAMFKDATKFNQDIGNWNTSKLRDMAFMFSGSAFDQDIGNWDVSNVTTMVYMLTNSKFSVANYDSLLLGWSTQQLQSNVKLTAGTSKYSAAAAAARQSLIDNFNWTITDGGRE